MKKSDQNKVYMTQEERKARQLASKGKHIKKHHMTKEEKAFKRNKELESYIKVR